MEPTTSKLKPVQLRAIALLALGTKQIVIQEQLDISKATLQRWLADREFQLALEAQIADAQEDAQRELRTLNGEAVSTLRLLMNNDETPPAVRSQIAFKILDLSAQSPIASPTAQTAVYTVDTVDKDPAIDLFEKIAGVSFTTG